MLVTCDNTQSPKGEKSHRSTGRGRDNAALGHLRSLGRGVVLNAQARIQGGGGWGERPPLGRRGFPRLKGRKKGHCCLLNGCSTPFRHNMAINILKSCKSVFAYVKNRSLPSHIRSSFPWRPPLAEILDPRLMPPPPPDPPAYPSPVLCYPLRSGRRPHLSPRFVGRGRRAQNKRSIPLES